MKKYELNQGARDVLAKMVVSSQLLAMEKISTKFGATTTKMARRKIKNTNSIQDLENAIINFKPIKSLNVGGEELQAFKEELLDEVGKLQTKVYVDNYDNNLMVETMRQDLQDGQGVQVQG